MIWEPGHDPDREQRIASLAGPLFVVVAALPRRSDLSKSDDDIRREALNIAQLTPWCEPFINSTKQASRSVVRKELDEFAKAIRRAERALLEFHSPSVAKALEADTSIWDLRQSLDDAIKFAATIDLISLDDVPAKIKRDREHSSADVVSMQCAMTYFRLTGRHPGRSNKEGERFSGLFERFLGDVFAIMNIDASADERARKAASEFKKRWGKGPKNRANNSI